MKYIDTESFYRTYKANEINAQNMEYATVWEMVKIW